jgi:hypothetical protein
VKQLKLTHCHLAHARVSGSALGVVPQGSVESTNQNWGPGTQASSHLPLAAASSFDFIKVTGQDNLEGTRTGNAI